MDLVRVKVVFYASLREAVGLDEIILKLNSPTLESLVNELRRALGERVGYVFAEDGSPLRGLLFSVNDRLIPQAELRGLMFKDGDVLDVMPPPSGG